MRGKETHPAMPGALMLEGGSLREGVSRRRSGLQDDDILDHPHQSVGAEDAGRQSVGGNQSIGSTKLSAVQAREPDTGLC
jgi:hypothetical protein